MRRCLLLIAVVSLGLSSLRVTDIERAQAQVATTDTVLFMAATRGIDYDGDGLLEWCWVMQSTGIGWHGSYGPGSPQTALDEVPQISKPKGKFANYCPSRSDQKVDLATIGIRNSVDCSDLSPCYSLRAMGSSGTYENGCTAIEVDLYDYTTWDVPLQNRDWKGKQRMLHSVAPDTSWTYFTLPHIPATSAGKYNRTEIGIVQNNTGCLGGAGFTDRAYHVHHDFIPPTVSTVPGYCTWNKNTNLAPTDPKATQKQADWQKEWPADWVHSLTHTPGIACLVPGPQAADWILRTGGELDGTNSNGSGARSLATGGPPITTYKCFSGTIWCGNMTMTQLLLLAAYKLWYADNVNMAAPRDGSSATWYNDQSYFFVVRFQGIYCDGNGCSPRYVPTFIGCGAAANGSEIWAVEWNSSAPITCGAISYNNVPGQNVVGMGLVQSLFSQFRGRGGLNPSVPPDQDNANIWVRQWIDDGKWASQVKPRIDAAIRAQPNSMGMHSIGITESPSFEGWVVLCRAGVGCY